VLRRPFLSALGLLGGGGTALLVGAGLYKDGPPPAHTGGFGEPTCRECHADADLNAYGGTLLLGGVPPTYEPGRSYDLAVTLRRAGMLRAGFQLAARFAEGERAGTQAGSLEPADQRAKVLRDSTSGVLYLEHTFAGTTIAGDSARWRLRWTAPGDARGAVVFHLAANAANDDDSPFGDFIYARVLQVQARRP
jgi:hypothetical protein